eukprot:14756541-Heterocapsa_arctica.AAC.1
MCDVPNESCAMDDGLTYETQSNSFTGRGTIDVAEFMNYRTPTRTSLRASRGSIGRRTLGCTLDEPVCQPSDKSNRSLAITSRSSRRTTS